MDLTGVPLLVTVIVLAVGLPAGAVALWSRVRGPAPVRIAQRLGLVVLCQVSAVLVAGVVVNNTFGLYESWSDLLGTDQVTGTVRADPSEATSSSAAEGGTAGLAAKLPPGIGGLPGQGRLRLENVTGPASGVHAKIWVLLPKGYDDAAQARTHYPVVMFLPGYPGTPTTWLHALHLQDVLDAETSAHRVPPLIAVLPTMNIAAPRDTECVDVPGGPQAGSWLAQDVPAIISAQTRALPEGKAWAVTGYSTGGFCTAKLVMTHPQTFGNGAVLAGYFRPSNDVTTGDLFAGQAALRDANDPMWLIAHRTPPDAHLLTVYSDQDPESAGPTRAFLAAARPPLQVQELVVTQGGHNTSVWLGVEPQVLRWLGARLASP